MIGYFNKKAFAELLRLALGRRSINQYERDSGVSAAHISRLMRELVDTPPSPQTIEKLSSKAHNGITYEDLMKAAGYLCPEPIEGIISVPQGTGRLKEPGNDHLEGSKNLPLVEVKKIPIYSLQPKSREMFFAPGNIIGYEPVPADTMANFAVKIDDDSMSGSRINKGDRAIIREQTTFADGQAVLAVIPDGTFTIRKAKRTNDGVILYPENNNYQPEHFTEDELQIIGIVVKVIFDYI